MFLGNRMDHMIFCSYIYYPIRLTKGFPIDCFCVEKIECSKLGVKLDWIPDMRLNWGWEEAEAKSETTSEVPSTQVLVVTVLTMVAWCPSPRLPLVLRNANNYSHCALDIGHWIIATGKFSTFAIGLEETWFALAFDFPLGLYPGG